MALHTHFQKNPCILELCKRPKPAGGTQKHLPEPGWEQDFLHYTTTISQQYFVYITRQIQTNMENKFAMQKVWFLTQYQRNSYELLVPSEITGSMASRKSHSHNPTRKIHVLLFHFLLFFTLLQFACTKSISMLDYISLVSRERRNIISLL